MTAPDPSHPSVGTVTTRYAYDGAGRLCRVIEHSTSALPADPCTDPISGATTSANVATRYTYDDNGNLLSQVDAAGGVSKPAQAR